MESEPWLPFFEMREDFLLAEIILEGCLGSELSDRLLKIFDICNTSKGRVTRQAGVDKRSLLIVNLFVDLCPIYLPLS